MPVPTGLFNLEEVINNQIYDLKRSDITVNKITEINGKREEVFFKPDSAFWNRELEVFSPADIGKPSMRDRYTISESDTLGYHITRYSSMDPKINGTLFLSVSKDLSGLYNEIMIQQRESNFLYQSQRNLRLKFTDNPSLGIYTLKSYGIKGYQKIIFRRPVKYEVDVQLQRTD